MGIQLTPLLMQEWNNIYAQTTVVQQLYTGVVQISVFAFRYDPVFMWSLLDGSEIYVLNELTA